MKYCLYLHCSQFGKRQDEIVVNVSICGAPSGRPHDREYPLRSPEHYFSYRA